MTQALQPAGLTPPPGMFGMISDFSELYLGIRARRPGCDMQIRHLQTYSDSQLRLLGRTLSILHRMTETPQLEPMFLSALLRHLQTDLQPRARRPEVSLFIQLVLTELFLKLDRPQAALRALAAALALMELGGDMAQAEPTLRQTVLERYRIALECSEADHRSEATSMAQTLTEVPSPLLWPRAADHPDSGRLRRTELLYGRLLTCPEMLERSDWSPTEKLLGLLGYVTALPPARQTEPRLRQQLRHWLQGPEFQSGETTLDTWGRILAHLLLGELGMAQHIQTDLRSQRTQTDANSSLIPLLLRAAQLEALIRSVQWETPQLVVAEQEFLAEFRQGTGQDTHQLAALVRRWHPVTAAYLSCLPHAPSEFFCVRSSILVAGNRNLAYDLTLPPAYAGELILRSFGCGIDRHKLPQAVLSTRMRIQRNRLEVLTGSARFWRPVVSGMLLACAYMRHGGPSYEAAARQVLRDFGTIPHTDYMDQELAQLETAVRGIVAGEHPRATLQLDRIL